MGYIKWIKLATAMPDDEKIKLIDAMPERDTIHYLWIRLLLQAGKTNADGEIFLSDGIPYTDKMLSVIFSRPLSCIKLALKTLSKFGMIEIDPDKIIRIVNWDKYQNIEGMEKVREQNRKRAENHREKKKQEKKGAKSIIGEISKNEVIEEDINLNENEELEENNILDDSKEKSNVNASASATTIKNNDYSDSKETTIENDKNNCHVTKKTCNVTQNKSNVTVTEQNKKEIKKKNKKREIGSEEDNNLIYLKGTSEVNKLTDADVNDVIHSEYSSNHNLKENVDDIKTQNDILGKYEIQSVDPDLSYGCARLSKYHESITGRHGGLENGKLRGAIAIHGEVNVKMAIDAAIKVGKDDINYINGILSNWRREGYPKDDMEVKKNGVRSIGKNNTADKNEFAGFKPKEPRKLTEAERKKAEANLI